MWALLEILRRTEHRILSTFWEIHWSEHLDLSTFFKLGLIWTPWSEHFCKNCSHLSSLIWALFWNLFKSERCCFSPGNQKCPWRPLSALLSSFLSGQKKYHANFLQFFHGQYHFFLCAILWNFLGWAGCVFVFVELKVDFLYILAIWSSNFCFCSCMRVVFHCCFFVFFFYGLNVQ